MAGPAARNGTDRKPPSSASQRLQLFVVCLTTHIYFSLAVVPGRSGSAWQFLSDLPG
jgi:hypothetical protein